MKNMILKIVAVLGCSTMFVGVNSCSDTEGCAENPQLCLVTCATNPEVCIDEDGKQIGTQLDSVEAVSKLPIRH